MTMPDSCNWSDPARSPTGPWPSAPRTQVPRGKSRPTHPAIHLLLFALTLFSMMAAGAMQQGVNPLREASQLVHLIEGIPFAGTLLAILTVHEFGHYFAARSWGVRASLPYFLPLPYLSFLGTLGAVIRIRSPIPHRRALLDIGAAGPLAGFVIAVAACVVGLPTSEIVGADYFRQLPRALEPESLELGSPLLFHGLSLLLLPELDPGQSVLLSPVAFAGWVGLFITAFNLFPVGQLDGGHIIYALLGRWHGLVGRITFITLLILGVYGVLSPYWGLPPGWPGWLVLAFLLLLFGRNHPPPYQPRVDLNRGRIVVGVLCFFIFALCVTPAPFRAMAV
ncbi:MAG: site-2 protease family protein [Candidatus Latescibacterota bacterium]|nr:site-2 protease family protein [Candidatus Latescibacterota bacterium]